MRKIWLVVFALALLGAAPAAFTQSAHAADDAAAICHQCEWIKIQIGDIDDKIASWERQIRSINKYSNLSDPNIQNALKDIDKTIAALKAKKADLESQLAECNKRCAAAQTTPPKPVTPGPSGNGAPSGGGSGGSGSSGTPGGGSSSGGPGADNGAPGTNNGPPPPDCPPANGPSTPATDGAGSESGAFRLELPRMMPPAPTGGDEKEDWDHLLDHMDDAESWDGDDTDVWQVADDIQDSIRDVMFDIWLNPSDEGAWARLHWLRKQEDYYGHWKTWIRAYWMHDDKYVPPSYFRRCSPLFQLPPKKEKDNDNSGGPLGDFSIGIGIGGGYGGDHHDNRDHGHDTHESTPPPQGRTTMPTSTEGSSH